ncbi:MAG: SdiA-regulated domain-containing protein [Pseudomonas sp.]|uniref:SdiA-regulated domain-containing protein n=1 Tax=Pseudomonas sp. TaxID=306 RepID=UPI003394AA9C
MSYALRRRAWRSAPTRLLQIGLFLLLALLVQQVLALQLHRHLSLWLANAQRDSSPAGVGLAGLRVRQQALPLAGIDGNLSGVVYDPQRDQLWSVVNSPPQLQLLSTSGAVLERYGLNGFQDVEDLTLLGDDLLLLVEERSHALVVVPLPTRSGPLERADYRAFTLGLGAGGNNGFEGVAYDREGDRLYVVKERSPLALYEIQGLRRSVHGAFDLAVLDRSAWVLDQALVTDLSAVHFDAASGHLLLLSDESRLLVELSDQGELIATRSLLRGFAGLGRSVPQAEGLTLDGHGNLYLVSEPNLFYRFSRGEYTRPRRRSTAARRSCRG